MWKRSGFLFFAIMAVALLGALGLDRTVGHHHLPWRSLNPDAPIGFATKSQFLRLAVSPSKTCMDMAQNAKLLNSVPADAHKPNKQCGWKIARSFYGNDAVTLRPGEANMQCPLALGSYIWMREVGNLAQKRFDTGLKKIHHAGTYSCRRQNGNNSGQWSEHAFANAWDITGFELNDGRVISIQKDWKGNDKTRRKFLRDARYKACKIFRVTLSPDFNDAHHDHFHVDMGPNFTCR